MLWESCNRAGLAVKQGQLAPGQGQAPEVRCHRKGECDRGGRHLIYGTDSHDLSLLRKCHVLCAAPGDTSLQAEQTGI